MAAVETISNLIFSGPLAWTADASCQGRSELFFAPTDPGQHPRHVDFIWPLWAVFDRTPEGRDADWSPQLDYP